MTIVAVGFGVSVAFAQTTPTQEDQSTIQTEQTTEIQEAEQGRRSVEMSELPLAVQEAFTSGEYSEWQVLGIYEKSSETAEGLVYEFELAQASEATEAAEGANDELAGVETERVSVRQPDLILQLNENGEILEEKDPDELEEEKLEE